jgi:SAM-dependent methyltransferase
MPTSQTFTEHEADQWFLRNREGMVNKKPQQDVIYRYIAEQAKAFNLQQVLEVGCSNGFRLHWLQQLGLQVAGFDISAQAIADGQQRYHLPQLFAPENISEMWRSGELTRRLPPESFDCIIFGHCLYVVSPTALADLVATTMRLLKPGGIVVIFDFESVPQRQPYHHAPHLCVYKMPFANLFTGLPQMKCIYQQVMDHSGEASVGNPKEDCALSVIRYCDLDFAYPLLEGQIRV